MPGSIQSICESSRAQLETIANELGIQERGLPAEFPAVRSFAELLRTCPDQSGARAIMRRQPAAASGFLFLAREFVTCLADGTTNFLERQPDDALGPWWYLADGVLSFMDQIEKYYGDKS